MLSCMWKTDCHETGGWNLGWGVGLWCGGAGGWGGKSAREGKGRRPVQAHSVWNRKTFIQMGPGARRKADRERAIEWLTAKQVSALGLCTCGLGCLREYNKDLSCKASSLSDTSMYETLIVVRPQVISPRNTVARIDFSGPSHDDEMQHFAVHT